MLSANGDMILGFSSDGAVIPAGEGVLTTISFMLPEDQICFDSVLMSDVNAQPMNFNLGGCYEINTYTETHNTRLKNG